MLNQAFAFSDVSPLALSGQSESGMCRRVSHSTLLPVPQSVQALKTVAFVFTAYIRYIMAKKTPFRIGMITRRRWQTVVRATERFESERIDVGTPSVSVDLAELRV